MEFFVDSAFLLSVAVVIILILYLMYNQSAKKSNKRKKKVENNADISIINQIPKKEMVIQPQHYKDISSTDLELKQKIVNTQRYDNNLNIYEAIVLESNGDTTINNVRFNGSVGMNEIYSADGATVNIASDSVNYNDDTKINIEEIYQAELAPLDTNQEINISSRNNSNVTTTNGNNSNSKLDIEPAYTTAGTTSTYYVECLPSYYDIVSDKKK